MDIDTLEFLEIVECEHFEVLDVPKYQPATEADRRRSLGGYQLYFGQHKGKPLSDVPRDYLEWLVSQKPYPEATKAQRKSFQKARRMAAAYLKTE